MMDMNGAPNKSTTVDILFENGDQSQDRYVIYMTESETEDYTWNIAEAQRLVSGFLAGKFELNVSRFLKTHTMKFTDPDLTYRIASLTKHRK